MFNVAVGTMVFNEAQNLGRLLKDLCARRPRSCRIYEIVVVVSGSTDGSVEIAQEWAQKDSRIRVIIECCRRGKARAINLFLESVDPVVDVCVITSADVIPGEEAIDRLVRPFSDERVGMTGARPCPTNSGSGILDRIVRFQWEMHHRVALNAPKMGELIAVRRVIKGLDPKTAVDEASLEAKLVRRGYKLSYVGDALVYNRGPGTWREFIKQRRRIWTGHLRLKQQHNYEVSTMHTRRLVGLAIAHVFDAPQDVLVASVAALAEGCARMLGTYDQVIRRRNPYRWEPLPSTKVQL